MILYALGTTRLVSRFVFRKRIGEDVRWFRRCCWEEEYQYHSGLDNFREFGFFPTKFVTRSNVQVLYQQITGT